VQYQCLIREGEGCTAMPKAPILREPYINEPCVEVETLFLEKYLFSRKFPNIYLRKMFNNYIISRC